MKWWRRWVRQPQRLFLRRAIFQIHLWTGIAIGLYVTVVCVSGSVLVYRNELYQRFSPQPVIVSGSGPAIEQEELTRNAKLAYPGYNVSGVRPGQTANHAVEITLTRGTRTMLRLFDPFTGEDLGNPLPLGFRSTAWLLDLHDNLLSGAIGRRVNGIGALSILLLTVSGAIVWWPGVKTWRRSLVIDRQSSWNRFNWSLHSALGFWFFGFILMWGITGAYLSFPTASSELFDWIEPFSSENPVERTVDRIQYWLAYLHFGRLGGRGIPACQAGVCDSISKAIWAVSGLVPALLFITGVVMWWNRVLRPPILRSWGASRGSTRIRR